MAIFSRSKSFLGIDIGASSIKIVELIKEGKRARVVTYGFSENILDLTPNNTKETAQIIKEICRQAGTTSREAVSALPTFSVFSSIINLSRVSKKELEQAVQWEAKKVIPLPLEEMILGWNEIEKSDPSDKKNIKVLLTAAPKELVRKYIEIFKAAQINLLSLETETFALIRSLLGNDKSTVMIIEIGAKTTNINIVKQGIPILSRSLDIGGLTITKAISNNLGIGLERAEQFKYDLGISSFETQGEVIPRTIIETVSPIINEIKYTFNLFQNKDNSKVEKLILTGGSALLINLPNYLAKLLDRNVIIGDPWARVSYPLDLKPMLNELGPKLATVIGLAMREIE